jgi:hypothetical protein
MFTVQFYVFKNQLENQYLPQKQEITANPSISAALFSSSSQSADLIRPCALMRVHLLTHILCATVNIQKIL